MSMNDLEQAQLAGESRRRVIDQLDIWRKQLINLARSNRLLYFRHTRSSTLELLGPPDYLAYVVATVLAGKRWHFFMPSENDSNDDARPQHLSAEQFAIAYGTEDTPWHSGRDQLVTSKATSRELLNALRALDRRSAQEFMDKGIWILYLTVGMLRWKDPDFPEEAESPLVLIPVKITRTSPREPYELMRVDEDTVLNPALQVKLAEFGVDLVFDDEEIDFSTTLDEIERAIATQRGWDVQRRLVVSPFSFHKEVMFRDLQRNESQVVDHPLVQALAVGAKAISEFDFDVAPEDQLDEQVPPEDTATIRDADSSQMQCIAAATAGRSFVMDGPPGTGKSQTIANIIAELLAKGKRVLFVSEKAAALEVVHKRLWEAGLGDYCLEIHSHKATRKEVAQQLGRALERHPTVPQAMGESALAQLKRRRHELSERATAMNVVRPPLGRSLHEVLGRISQLHSVPQAPPPMELGSWLPAETLAEVLGVAGELARAWGPVTRGEDFVWRDIANVTFDASRGQRTQAQLEFAITSLDRVERAAADASEALLLPAPSELAAAESLARVLRHLKSRPGVVLPSWLSRSDLSEVETLLEQRHQLALASGLAEEYLLETIGDRWRDLRADSATEAAMACTGLQALEPSFEPPDSLPVDALTPVVALLAETAAVLEAAARDVETIASTFELPTAPMTLSRAADLAELALLAGEAIRPEPEWVDPTRIASVEEAAKLLEPLCAALNDRRTRLLGTFSDDVLALDLDGICRRFDVTHVGLGKLRSGYRVDRDAVARVARVGKATKEVIAQLPEALEWQRLTAALKSAEVRDAAVLGNHYYQSAATDFDVLARALHAARRALDLAGEHLNLSALRRQVARNGTPDAQVLPVAARLKSSIEQWTSRAPSVLGTFAEMLLDAELRTASEWCASAERFLGKLIELGGEVSRIGGHAITVASVRAILDARSAAGTIETTLAATRDDDTLLLGPAYRMLETNWDELTAALDWSVSLRGMLDELPTTRSAERLASADVSWRELDSALDDWQRNRDAIASQFLDERAAEVRADLNTTFADTRAFLAHLATTIGDIEEWAEFRRARDEAVALKFGNVVAFCETTRLEHSQLVEVIERAFLERWADAVMEQDYRRLRQVRSDQLDPLVAEFRDLDKELIARAPNRVISACNARRPRSTIGAAGIIKREAEKQRRHMPIRTLLEQTADVAQLLKPCFMMSPLTVSQFLPPSLRFDAVIFDEASQVRPCDAINCIYRGAQLLIAGDDKQLPPTSFFEALSVDGDDEWEEDQFEEFESIIKLGKGSGGLKALPLRWHYRSQHEDLIAYSNFSFYEGRLITFPGSAAEAGDLGVKFFHVPDGVYRRGTARDNPKEAEFVVDRIVHWARRSLDDPTKAVTLGVVAFSEAQAEAVETALDRRRQGLPELDAFFRENRLDGFFVKNLENVQGDERDVMIFSVGYGRDEVGKLTMNFGPLNREGGERRLNVAITRARRRVELVSSVTGTEPEFMGNLGPGPRHLQRYLDYAARGPATLAIDVGEEGGDAESPFEEEVIRTVRSWGYNVKPQVGTAGYRVDIGVWNPSVAGRFALGIECDGRMYHSSHVARDRDRLRQEVLQSLGWRIYRVWGTAWYRHRREEELRLRAAIEYAIQNYTEPIWATSVANTERGISEKFEPVSLDTAPSWTVRYRIATPSPPRYQVDMHLPDAVPELRRMMLEVIDVEGPIENELLLRRVREAWGIGRAGARIRDNFFYVLRSLVQREQANWLESTFTYARPEQLTVVRIPGDDPAAVRSVAQVSSREQVNAIRHLVEDAHRVTIDQLTFEVCRLFGWNRRGSDIAAALERSIEALIAEGEVSEENGFLKLV